MYYQMLAHPGLANSDLTSLSRCTVGGQTTPRAKLEAIVRRFGCPALELWGISICRMFNQARWGQQISKRVSTDHDPLFRFHCWRAKLRILDIEELKSVPFVPRSHPFIERLMGPFGASISTRPSSGSDSAARPRRTEWPNALRAIRRDCMPTGKSSSLRLAIRLFPPLSHANCRVIRKSPWSPLLARRHADGRRIALECVRFAIATCSARRLIENQNARMRGVLMRDIRKLQESNSTK
jgi:hypothetical protein